MKKRLFHLTCWAAALGILAYLFWRANRSGALARVRIDSAGWRLLAGAACLTAAASAISYLRWRLLAISLKIDFPRIRALQIGFLSELLNYLAFGALGGDLAKVVFIARNQPGRRIQAASTVLADRLAGFYSLFLLASCAILAGGLWRTAAPAIRGACGATLAATAIASAGLFIALAVSGRAAAWSRRLDQVPYIGSRAREAIEALAEYRRRRRVLAVAVAMGLCVHSLGAVAIYATARAVTSRPPSLARHLVITPLATSSAVLPLPAQGLGAFEWVLDTAYQQMSPDANAPAGRGLLVALVYRVVSLVAAGAGAGVCFAVQPGARRVLREAATARDP